MGATSLVDPVPGFMPYIEFRDRVDNWRWIGEYDASYSVNIVTGLQAVVCMW